MGVYNDKHLVNIIHLVVMQPANNIKSYSWASTLLARNFTGLGDHTTTTAFFETSLGPVKESWIFFNDGKITV